MRLPERFRSDEALDPEVEAELAVIDAALSGGPVPADSQELAQFARELRAERAEPAPALAAQLDRWAASGFAKAERRKASPGSQAAERSNRFAGLAPRRLIAPVGAVATLVVVVGIAVSSGGLDTGGDQDQSAGGGDAAVQDLDDSGGTVPAPETDAESGDSAGLEQPAKPAPDPVLREGTGFAGEVPPDERKVVRTADLTLATEPEDVREVSDGVNEVTNRYRGIVVSSSVQSGDSDRAALSSQFRLRIPAGELQAALADLSELAHVQSRTESTEDITGQFLSAQERIEELEAEREGLLTRLADAETEEAADVLRRQVDAVNSQLQATRAELEEDRQRVSLVPVTVTVVAEEGAGDDGDWSISDALEDAGEVLSMAAGVIVIAGAVLLPLALVGLLVALILRTRTNRARDRALDE